MTKLLYDYMDTERKYRAKFGDLDGLPFPRCRVCGKKPLSMSEINSGLATPVQPSVQDHTDMVLDKLPF